MRIEKRVVIPIVLSLIVLAFLSYNLAAYENCTNSACFQDNLAKCNPSSYVNEQTEASWGYKIVGKSNGLCKVQVTLLSAKEGSLSLRRYEGNSMECFLTPGSTSNPEADLDLCHGELKENLQTVLIEKLYKYIIGNLNQIQQQIQ